MANSIFDLHNYILEQKARTIWSGACLIEAGEFCLARTKEWRKNRKGAGGAALLVLLVGLIIILYLLFMPPGAREALLNGVP